MIQILQAQNRHQNSQVFVELRKCTLDFSFIEKGFPDNNWSLNISMTQLEQQCKMKFKKYIQKHIFMFRNQDMFYLTEKECEYMMAHYK